MNSPSPVPSGQTFTLKRPARPDVVIPADVLDKVLARLGLIEPAAGVAR